MAHLIQVTNYNTKQTIVLNADQIIQAWSTTMTQGTFTTIKMANGDQIAVSQGLDDLIGLSDRII
jgi:hypothetical protein